MLFKKSEKSVKIPRFWGNKRSSIGVEVGSAAVRMVLLEAGRGNAVRRAAASVCALPPHTVRDHEIVDWGQLLAALQECYAGLQTNCKTVAFALPTNCLTLEHNLHLDAADDEALADAVEAEVARLGDVDDIYFDWQTVPDADAQNGGTTVMLVAAQARDVQQWDDVLTDAGLQPMCADADVLALCNAFSYCYPEENGLVMLIDVSEKGMYAVLMKAGRMLFRHHSMLGLSALLGLIQAAYHAGQSDALAMFAEPARRPEDYADRVSAVFAQQIAREAEHVLQFFAAERHQGTRVYVDKILIGGYACAGDEQCAEAVSAYTGSPAFMMDALGGCGAAYAGSEHGNALNTAFGLALKGLG